ncbi:MAG TPA: DUF3761 domain-containing protein [Pseudomonadales bacterium]|nr:DUF3761 domain-containing protein [Pseudomonadales bacterium]
MALLLAGFICISAIAGDNKSDQVDESQLKEHGSYTNSSGHVVHSPAHAKSDVAPSGATAKCGDGTYSFSQHRRGTCSHHGGVSEWF